MFLFFMNEEGEFPPSFFSILLDTLRLLLKSVCSGNAESQLEAVIEYLVGRQGQPMGAQVHAVLLSDWKRWS